MKPPTTTSYHESLYKPDENPLRPNILKESELKPNEEDKNKSEHEPDNEKQLYTHIMNKIFKVSSPYIRNDIIFSR